MKKLGINVLIIVAVLVSQGCGSKNKSKEIAQYQTSDTNVQLSDVLQKKVGNWIQEGMDCYGVVISTDADGNILAMKEIKAKVQTIQNEKIKMKALEEVSLAPKSGCSKIGISKGETWWEEEGDLFQTREQAIEFIKLYKSRHQPAPGAKFTID